MTISNKSLNIGTYAGIPVKIHWTFGFLLLFVAYTAYDNQMSIKASLIFMLYVLILFLCVTLHEYGHALMGRKFGIQTSDILLTPIGGIARMGQMTKNPKHEFLIALAGPFVNVIIAIILAIFIYFQLDAQYLPQNEALEDVFNNFPELLRMVFLMNIVLFLFNLIPAYPMDGGRVLRSIIAMVTNFEKATIYATWIGMILATIFAGLAIYWAHPTLGFIAIFVFFMANKERQITNKNMFLLSSIDQYINRNPKLIHNNELYENVISFHNTSEEKNYLVVNEEQNIIGTIPEPYIIEAKKSFPTYQFVHQLMRTSVGKLDNQTSIVDAANYMNQHGFYIVPVFHDNQFVGTISRTTINQLYKR